ncbi:hypothetical protein MCP1_130085 [Candidatus Terasakiella magnetica]|nr:hypothetical protein MCP1_130085 [Candidatus Terasakiella magnetica]
MNASKPQPPSPEDVALSRRIFFGLMAILAVLLGSLAYGALK